MCGDETAVRCFRGHFRNVCIIMHRLEELMRWQRQQQEKLLLYQKEQKELLSQEQQHIYQVFGLKDKEKIYATGESEEPPKHSQEIHAENTNTSENAVHSDSANLSEAVTEIVLSNKLQMTDTAISHKSITEVQDRNDKGTNLDDVPIQTSSKDFFQLLQKNLESGQDDAQTNSGCVQNKAKKKFLRKGEGTARFFKNSAENKIVCSKAKTTAKHVKPSLGAITGPLKLKSNNCDKSRVTKEHAGVAKSLMKSKGDSVKVPVNRKLALKGPGIQACPQTILPTWSHVLKSSSKGLDISLDSSTEFERRKNKELEELRVFELLEEHADHSSFCSTSSLVAQLMEDSIKSTPIKAVRTALPIVRKQEQLVNSNSLKALTSHLNHRMEVKDKNHEKCNSLHVWQCSEDLKRYVSSENINVKSRTSDNDAHISILPLLNLDKWNTNNQNGMCVRFAPDCSYKSDTESVVISDQVQSDMYCSNQEDKDCGQVAEFQDEQAWSDACSCSSYDQSDSDTVIEYTEKKDKFCNDQQLSVKFKGDQEPSSKKDIAYGPISENEQVKELTSVRNAGEDQDISFKSSLLKDRLDQLEKEMSIFQAENANLLKLQNECKQELAHYKKERKDLEKKMHEEQERMEALLQEERKKLIKQRQVFEKYFKGHKNNLSREERIEIQALRQQVADLKEEVKKKDSRWSATQIRTHNRIQQLGRQITQLKEENEALKQDKERIKKVRFSNHKVKANMNALHTVNEHLGKLTAADVKDAIVIKNVVPKKRIPVSILSGGQLPSKAPLYTIQKENEWGLQVDGQPKQFMCLPDLDPDVTTDDINEEIINSVSGEDAGHTEQMDNGVMKEKSTEVDDSFHEANEVNGEMNKLIKDALFSTLEEMNEDMSEKQCNTSRHAEINIYDDYLRSIKNVIEEERNNNKYKEKDVIQRSLNDDVQEGELLPNGDACSEKFVVSPDKAPFVETVNDNGTRERVYPDGRLELWYPNGNVKKLSADKLTMKIIYYNGDVKEKFLPDGTEKYYYAETKTWHTTYLDGLEVLEFPNGQVERHHPDGTMEICYANGCVQLCYADEHEEWAMADGTVIKKEKGGDRVLLLPNGQREVHTSQHKRREYPDGTVKFLYPDGQQETRYASGRIRLKDKDGKLVMDTGVG